MLATSKSTVTIAWSLNQRKISRVRGAALPAHSARRLRCIGIVFGLTSVQVRAGDAQRIIRSSKPYFISLERQRIWRCSLTLLLADFITLYFYLPAADFAEAFVRLVNAKRCERPPPEWRCQSTHMTYASVCGARDLAFFRSLPPEKRAIVASDRGNTHRTKWASGLIQIDNVSWTEIIG